MMVEEIDVLVIGAGPAGTVAASIINRAGYKTKIVEKELFPRFVIGESLLPKCMDALEDAGFLSAIKAQGYQEKFGAKFVNAAMQEMDFNFSDQYTQGWSWTWQVPRADFDHCLAREVERMGVPVEYQQSVTDIQFHGTQSTTTVTDIDGNTKQIKAKFIVDGSGWGRVIPRLFNMDKPSNLPTRKTLFAHIKDDRRAQYVEPNRILIVDHSPGVWAWCIPFSNGNTSCGFVGYPEFFDSILGTAEDQLRALIASNPNIAERFQDCEMIWEPRTIEAWSVTTERFFGDGFVLTGNSTEFLDPIFSSGVTLATVSSQRAAHLVVKHLSGAVVDWEQEFSIPTMIGVNAFRTYVMAWYDGTLQKIFFNENKPKEYVDKICSVLAGYVWDETNPFVIDSDRSISRLARIVELDKQMAGIL